MYPNDGIAGMYISKTDSWRRLNLEARGMHYLGFAAGSRYWHTGNAYGISTVYALDHNALPDAEDYVYHPSIIPTDKMAVSTGRDGKTRILFLGADDNLKIFTARHGGSEWALEKSIQLSAAMLGVPLLQEHCYVDQRMSSSANTTGTVLILAYRERTEPCMSQSRYRHEAAGAHDKLKDRMSDKDTMATDHAAFTVQG